MILILQEEDGLKLTDPDDSGRKKPVLIENSLFNIKVDMAIKALGFDPEDIPYLFEEEKLKITRWGTLKIDFDTMETSIPGVFAAGDIVRGASLVVWAIRDGRDVSKSIINYIKSNRKEKVA